MSDREKVLLNLADAIQRAGGSVSLLERVLDKPATDLLYGVMAPNGIRFVTPDNDLLDCVNYLLENERKHFEESDCPEDHIYAKARRLSQWVSSL